MKKFLLSILLCFITLSFTMVVHAEVQSDFGYYENESGIAIGTYFGSDTVVNIPETIDGKPVTEILPRAFYNHTEITNFTIPETVRKIGVAAFENTEFYKNNSNFKDGVLLIGKNIIAVENYVKGDFKIDNDILCVADGALGDTNITSFSIGTQNQNYTISDGVLFSIDKDVLVAYPSNSSNTEYTVPDSVKSISACAFGGCKNLTEVTIPDSVKAINSYTFLISEKLQKINLPKNLERIGENAFFNTQFFNTDSNWTDDVLYLDNFLISTKKEIKGDYTIKDNTTLIADAAFANCKDLNSITIPKSVTKIPEGAFYQCDNLTTVNLPDTITEIGKSAFMYCKKLQLNKLPSSLVTVRENAFHICDSITEMTVPDSVETIEQLAFGTTYDEENKKVKKLDGFILRGKSESAAETYAVVSDIQFENTVNVGAIIGISVSVVVVVAILLIVILKKKSKKDEF